MKFHYICSFKKFAPSIYETAERRNDLGQGMSEGYSFSFLRSLFAAETAAFVAAPLAGEAIRAWILPVPRFAILYIDQSPVIRQLFK